MTRNIRLVLEYDGTNYGGWQRQKNASTIQEMVESSVKTLTNENVEVVGCSRTDAGVHAKGFVCNFITGCRIPEDKFKDALNSKLPRDIVVLSSEEVSEGFHSRYSCKGKTYSYTILNRNEPTALQRNYVFQYKYKLQVDSMREAAKYIVGTHDFAAFRNIGSSVKTSIRTVTQLEVEEEKNIVRIWATADGFLYNMVRIITGTLIEVGIGKIKPDKVKAIILSGDRKQAGASAPPQGLCLEKVFY